MMLCCCFESPRVCVCVCSPIPQQVLNEVITLLDVAAVKALVHADFVQTLKSLPPVWERSMGKRRKRLAHRIVLALTDEQSIVPLLQDSVFHSKFHWRRAMFGFHGLLYELFTPVYGVFMWGFYALQSWRE